MIATCVTVFVKPNYIDDFIEASIINHEGSIKEPENLRFDVLQCRDDPSRFFLYEAYKTEEAALAHKTTDHYLKWREIVAEWMKKPREGIKYTNIRPKTDDWK